MIRPIAQDVLIEVATRIDRVLHRETSASQQHCCHAGQHDDLGHSCANRMLPLSDHGATLPSWTARATLNSLELMLSSAAMAEVRLMSKRTRLPTMQNSMAPPRREKRSMSLTVRTLLLPRYRRICGRCGLLGGADEHDLVGSQDVVPAPMDELNRMTAHRFAAQNLLQRSAERIAAHDGDLHRRRGGKDTRGPFDEPCEVQKVCRLDLVFAGDWLRSGVRRQQARQQEEKNKRKASCACRAGPPGLFLSSQNRHVIFPFTIRCAGVATRFSPLVPKNSEWRARRRFWPEILSSHRFARCQRSCASSRR